MSMAKFRFRLEVSLRLAEQVLDKNRRLLAQEVQAYQACTQEVNERSNIWEEGIKGQRQAGLTKPDYLGIWQVYNQKKLEELELSLERLTEQEKRVEGARQEVVKAHRELEKYRKLKEKQAVRFKLEEQRKEQALLDEAGQAIYSRSSSKG